MSEEIIIKHALKKYGDNVIIPDLSLDIREGEFFTLLGPSGCGKTTLLRIIAGLEYADSGTIHVGERDLTPIPVEKRNIGVVFQNYALIPHMTVFNNIAYGLKIRKVPKEQIREKVRILSDAMQKSVAVLPGGSELRISISGGIAWYPTDGHDLLTLKKYADFAMYQVKHSHKGRMCDFDIGSYHQEAYAAQTQQDFALLLQEELVSYHFQPIYSARSGRVAAYEALMRVDLPTLHSPAQVMQLAHETGRLYEIERITVFHSSEIFQRLQAQGLLQSDALLFINSIANVSLTVEDVEEYAQRYPELLKRLVVEITEQEDLDRACLERKRNVPGFSGSFALDDYGSGYSNELNLLELSPRYIKIDISIVRGIDTDRDKQQIVSNIVAYAHARSMQLIAEGIETEAQLRTVIGLGVDLLQGYYLSRPAAVPTPIAPAAQAVIDQLEHQRFDPLGL